MEDVDNSTSGVVDKTKVLIIIIVVVLLGVLGYLGYTYYNIKKSVTSNQASFTPDPNTTGSNKVDNVVSVEPKSYSNDNALYTFTCPANSRHIEGYDSSGKAVGDPFLQDICVDAGNVNNKVEIYAMPADATESGVPSADFEKEFVHKSGKIRVFLRGTDKTYFDQVVASFEFSQ